MGPAHVAVVDDLTEHGRTEVDCLKLPDGYFQHFPHLTELQVSSSYVRQLDHLRITSLTIVDRGCCQACRNDTVTTVQHLGHLTHLNMVTRTQFRTSHMQVDFASLPRLRYLAVSQADYPTNEGLRYTGQASSSSS